MGFIEWSESSFEYGRKVLSSGLEGARSGRDAFFNGGSVTRFLNESVHKAWKPGVIGVCVGVLGSIPGNRHKSISRMLGYGFIGGAIGYALGIAWGSRRLTESITSGALQSIGKVRDEHWLESHPIDYA